MWQLNQISATNICAFESLEYKLVQNQATLIFGNNMDSDSQNSNGSGKSALIEAIAIGLTGDPLRKVNIDEIINDRFDSATVTIELHNSAQNIKLTVARRLFRKQPQEIIVTRQTGPYDTDYEEIKQASVADYNKYVLDQIGITKDDLFSNFILTARKYKSFLSSSDKEKKEIINRFSNGIIVDQSIEELIEDMKPVEEAYAQADAKVLRITGSISAIEYEIQRTINEGAERTASRQLRIESLRQQIAEKRSAIHEHIEQNKESKKNLENYNEFDTEVQKLENSNADLYPLYFILVSKFYALGLEPLTNYSDKAQALHSQLEDERDNINMLNEDMADAENKVDELTEKLDWIVDSNNIKSRKLDEQEAEIEHKINSLAAEVKALKEKSKDLSVKRGKLLLDIGVLNAKLAGVIQCPKCHHEFVLEADVDVEKAREELDAISKRLETVDASINKTNADYEKVVEEGKEQRINQNDILDARQSLKKGYNDALNRLNEAKSKLAEAERRLASTHSRTVSLQEQIENLRNTMFDEVYNIIDRHINEVKKQIGSREDSISIFKSAIEQYERQISDAESNNDDNLLSNLKASLDKYQKELEEAVKERGQIESKLNELKKQEAIFTEFKTHLANTRINAISQITNNFLETIGSDIRVAFSGYTILKSGKIRDKISITLIRDGMDCGSFDKFSKGEQTRVELASILALHELTNVNAEEGKGLNLLVIDEILDATDEQGLANVFKALNSSQVTSLVVSHGNIAENYPNRLVICKQDGVSFIE